MELEKIRENLKVVKQNIDKVKKEMNYDYNVTIIGVTKTQPDEVIKFISDEKLFTDVGENYIQEFVRKYDIDTQLNWHAIGQLQSNKVKYIIDKACLIHSLDRESLAIEINKQAIKHNKVMDCLIELNMGSELSKGGIDPEDLLSFAKLIDENYKNIRIRGIMAIMPNLGECDELVKLYVKFYECFNLLKDNLTGRHVIDIRSCGMSNDYALAVKYAKSTHVRIGRAIFGERN